MKTVFGNRSRLPRTKWYDKLQDKRKIDMIKVCDIKVCDIWNPSDWMCLPLFGVEGWYK